MVDKLSLMGLEKRYSALRELLLLFKYRYRSRKEIFKSNFMFYKQAKKKRFPKILQQELQRRGHKAVTLRSQEYIFEKRYQ